MQLGLLVKYRIITNSLGVRCKYSDHKSIEKTMFKPTSNIS
jgi:hypothetical protein